MLDAARRRLAGHRNVEFLEGDLSRLPIADASINGAVLALVLHHIDEPVGALAEARRVIRPGGVVLIVDMLAHDRAEYRQSMGHKHQGFDLAAFGAAMERAGLTDVCTRELPREPEARGPGLFAATGRRPG